MCKCETCLWECKEEGVVYCSDYAPIDMSDICEREYLADLRARQIESESVMREQRGEVF